VPGNVLVEDIVFEFIKVKIYDRVTTSLVHRFPFLEMSFLEKLDFLCYLGDVSTAVLRIDHCKKLFFFI
jgi:hypothetical protein